MLEAFRRAAGTTLPVVSSIETRSWRWSGTRTPLGSDCLWDEGLAAGVCGDWCPGGRVEGAWISGTAIAEAMLAG